MVVASASIPSLETELRHLSVAYRHQLNGLLDLNDNWKSLAAVILNPDRPGELLLKNTDILLLEEQRKRPGGSPSNALFEYWSTYGRKRHTYADAIYYLNKCALNRASDVIKRYISLHNPNANLLLSREQHDWSDLPEYTSFADGKFAPTAPNESLISFSVDERHTVEFDTNLQIGNSQLLRIEYKSLLIATDNFTSKSIDNGGTKLGEGSFGEVFRCATALMNFDSLSHLKFVAVKRFKQLPAGDYSEDDKKGQFLSELNIMCRFQHPNLVKLFGYSNDGPYLCIITEYLSKGSLHSYMSNKSNLMAFSHRFQIATDIADAIVYLHNYQTIDPSGKRIGQPFIHRDIKSANIFLDSKLCARLGDLGLVRQGSTSNTQTTVVTNTVIGTSVYMAPEAFRGDVSVKIDTFSYGVVLLELLTGLSAFDCAREESDIVSYIDETLGDEFDKLSCFDNLRKDLSQFIESSMQVIEKSQLNKILDKNCHNWDYHVGQAMILLAKCCIEQRKKNRPTMIEVRGLNMFQLALNYFII